MIALFHLQSDELDTKQKAVFFTMMELLFNSGDSLAGLEDKALERLIQIALKFIAVGNIVGLQCILKYGGSLSCTDYGGRNILHIAVVHKKYEVINWLRTEEKELFGKLLAMKDMVNRSPIDDALALNDPLVLSCLAIV